MGIPLEKKTGTNFGPPGNCKLVYFLDDLNLPEVCYLSRYKKMCVTIAQWDSLFLVT